MQRYRFKFSFTLATSHQSLATGLLSLPQDFVHHHAGGHGNVQGGHAALHGNGDQEIAFAADEIVQSVTFRAQHQSAIHVVVERVVALRAPFIEADGPNTFSFQFFHRATDVGDAGDGQVLGGAGGNLSDSGSHAGGAALGNHNAIGAGRIGGADDGAQIVRIFHAIEHHDEGKLAAALRQQIV